MSKDYPLRKHYHTRSRGLSPDLRLRVVKCMATNSVAINIWGSVGAAGGNAVGGVGGQQPPPEKLGHLGTQGRPKKLMHL